MTIRRAFRTSARAMLISQFSAVDRPLTLAPSGAVMPTRSAIGATSRAMARQSTRPKRVRFGMPSMMFWSTVMPGTKASSWWMKFIPSSVARCGVSMAAGVPSIATDAAVGMDKAGEDADEGGLSRAVGADQAVDFARHDVERDSLQRLGAAEALGDVPHDDERGRLRRPHPKLRGSSSMRIVQYLPA